MSSREAHESPLAPDHHVKYGGISHFSSEQESMPVGGQVAQQNVEPQVNGRYTGGVVIDSSPVTIGEALEATAMSGTDKLVDENDIAAIQAAESLATGIKAIRPGDLAAAAQSAAKSNSENKEKEDNVHGITVFDVLINARTMMVADKVVMPEDVKVVTEAEMNNKHSEEHGSGIVPAGIAAASLINQGHHEK